MLCQRFKILELLIPPVRFGPWLDGTCLRLHSSLPTCPLVPLCRLMLVPCSPAATASCLPAALLTTNICCPLPSRRVQVQAPTPSGGGLASWLRLSSHLSKPAEEELEASLSPEDSGSAEDSPSQPRSQLDFGAVAVQAQPLPSPTAAPQAAVQAEPEPPSPVPAGTDAAGGAASPTAATSVSPKPAAAGCPIPAAAAGSSAPAALQPARRRQTHSRPVLLRAVLALCLLGAMLGAPVALLHLQPQLASHPGEPASWQAWRRANMSPPPAQPTRAGFQGAALQTPNARLLAVARFCPRRPGSSSRARPPRQQRCSPAGGRHCWPPAGSLGPARSAALCRAPGGLGAPCSTTHCPAQSGLGATCGAPRQPPMGSLPAARPGGADPGTQGVQPGSRGNPGVAGRAARGTASPPGAALLCPAAAGRTSARFRCRRQPACELQTQGRRRQRPHHRACQAGSSCCQVPSCTRSQGPCSAPPANHRHVLWLRCLHRTPQGCSCAQAPAQRCCYALCPASSNFSTVQCNSRCSAACCPCPTCEPAGGCRRQRQGSCGSNCRRWHRRLHIVSSSWHQGSCQRCCHTQRRSLAGSERPRVCQLAARQGPPAQQRCTSASCASGCSQRNRPRCCCPGDGSAAPARSNPRCPGGGSDCRRSAGSGCPLSGARQGGQLVA